MSFNIKKLYKNTIKTLEKHQMEITIAIAALTIAAFGPSNDEETKAHEDVVNVYKKVLSELDSQLEILHKKHETI